ncbi:MAG: hypothetical protein AMXMBFR7_02510 [Planctomycetota bacterium]
MNAQALFVEAVRAMPDLPELLRAHAGDVTGLEECRFDYSYIEFLDTQIRLSPRGPAWTEQLNRRRAALLPFCNVTLLRGIVTVGDSYFTVQIHVETKDVIHWEQEKYDPAAKP